MEQTDFWRKCSTCKKPIGFNQKYWVCSVSTCNRQRTNLAFCDVACFDSHIPIFNHRDAGAFERKSPSLAEWQQMQSAIAEGKPLTASVGKSGGSSPDEILVVVSKVKELIRVNSGLNTSDGLMPVLSNIIRQDLDRAIAKANAAGRKTVMERDFD